MSGKQNFIPGIVLNRDFYAEAVRPLLESRYPKLPHAAALIGYGSDVLGFDTPVSMDHNWGPRLQVFLSEGDLAEKRKDLDDILSWHLPGTFRGLPVNFSDPRTDHTQSMQPRRNPPWRHLVEITGVTGFFGFYLNPDKTDWGRLTDQRLLELTGGKVFHDGTGELTAARQNLAFWPRDFRLIRLAALWDCIQNEEAFVGRARDLEDPVGAKIIASRMAGWLIKICFYLENRYIPYSKWLGTAWKTLHAWPEINPPITRILDENDPAVLANRVAEAAHIVLEYQNRQGDIPQILLRPVHYYGRPYKALMAQKIVAALREGISDPEIRDSDLNITALDIKLDSCVLK
jgi:hypothetical protein